MTKSSSHSRNIFSDGSLRLAVETVRQAVIFGKQANTILATHESARSRIITVEESYKKLTRLSVKQDDLFRQSLRCIEFGLFRAAHVLGWAGVIDFFEEKLSEGNFKLLKGIRQSWNLKSIEDLREIAPDFQVIDALRELRFCSKTEEKALKGLLNKRNECAHPTDYYPGLNETLGYISEILQRLKQFQQRWA